MARKNSKVRNNNSKGRMARGERGQRRPHHKFPDQPRVPVEEMIMPDGQCSFQGKPKARFGTKEKAAAALKQAQQQRRRTGSHHVEKRYFACPEGGCGGFHLTSREQFDDSIRKLRRQQFEEKTKNARRAQIAAEGGIQP